MTRRAWFSFAAVLCLAGARDARAQFPRINAKLTAKSVTLRKIVILPAQVSFARQGAKGSESMAPEAAQIGESVYSAVSRELVLRGIEVLPNPLEQAKDDAARYAIADLQARYDNVAVQVRRKPARVETGRITLGDRVARFDPGAAADALMFIRGAGVVRTSAKKAISLATWGIAGLMPWFHGEVVIVDAKTGEVLAYLRFDRLQDMTQKTDERFSRSIREMMRHVPLPLPPPKG